ncbi:MAG: tRNA-dihydrouridine synthase [Candidatus Poseidoniales archaeon]|nr:MAG: tRNA-dihydrouridine synthase [Candidatus Poseidoniales archaeon]
MSEFIGTKRGPWDGEQRPLYLAPMSGVTDLPYRLLAKECGADVTITEFTNSTALTREAATSWRRMETHETEVPFIPQIFGGDPGDMATAAEMLAPAADVIDLNFGCPAPKVTNICAGAALMGEPDRLVNMVETIVDRVNVPVTPKNAMGTGEPERTIPRRFASGSKPWGREGFAFTAEPSSSGTPVRLIGPASKRPWKKSRSRWWPTGTWLTHSAAACLTQTGASGLMIGRGAIGRPTVFSDIKVGLGWMKEDDLPWVAQHDDWHGLSEIGRAFVSRKWCWDRYIDLSEATVGIQGKWMQRHAIAFTKGLPGAKKVRTLMHEQDTAKAMADAISGFLAGV